MSDTKPRRCGARIRKPFKVLPNGTVKHRAPFCQAWAMPNGKCRAHGGGSTGPTSPEAKAKLAARAPNMVEGRRRYLAELAAKGKRVPWGRKPCLKAKVTRAKEEARVAAMPPIERQREAALAAIARMKASLEARQ